MTVTSYFKKTEIGKETFFVERYWEKGWKVSLWRYGYYSNERQIVLKDHLRSKPNLKRMFAS